MNILSSVYREEECHHLHYSDVIRSVLWLSPFTSVLTWSGECAGLLASLAHRYQQIHSHKICFHVFLCQFSESTLMWFWLLLRYHQCLLWSFWLSNETSLRFHLSLWVSKHCSAFFVAAVVTNFWISWYSFRICPCLWFFKTIIYQVEFDNYFYSINKLKETEGNLHW